MENNEKTIEQESEEKINKELTPVNEILLNKNGELNFLEKDSIKKLTEKLKTEIEEGSINPVKVGVMLKKMMKLGENVFKDDNLKKIITDETEKYISGSQDGIFGAKISLRATSTFHDFSECNNPLLNKLYEIRDSVLEIIKEQEDELKELIKPDKIKSDGLTFSIDSNVKKTVIVKMPELIWEETGEGEEITMYPPKKIQKQGLVYSNL